MWSGHNLTFSRLCLFSDMAIRHVSCLPFQAILHADLIAASTATDLELQQFSMQRRGCLAHPKGAQETNNIVEKWNECCDTCHLKNNRVP